MKCVYLYQYKTKDDRQKSDYFFSIGIDLL